MGKLIGKCVGCGTCCENVQFVLPGGDVVREWGIARGFEIIQESGGYIEFRIHAPCPHLKNGKCDIHENKPLVCREYPTGMPEYWLSKGLDPNKSMGKKCGFRWVEQERE